MSMNNSGEDLCSDVVRSCRIQVRNTVLYEPISKDSTFQCYTYFPNGKYYKYYLPAGVENLARFINSSNLDKLICNSMDYPILNTQGNIIDLAAVDQTFLSNLLSYLEPLQKNGLFTTFEEQN